jgi:hypothetical protein
MADFSLTTLFVVPSTQSALPAGSSTDSLTAGQFGIFTSAYVASATAATLSASPYIYFAQGRTNTYLQGSKRSDKVSGKNNAGAGSNVTEWYKVVGSATAATQVTDVSAFHVKAGDVITLTLRAHSSYIDTLYFNGFTRSVTVVAPCLACGGDPCAEVDVPALIDSLIAKLQTQSPGINPDNISLNNFYQFQRVGTDENAILRISGKALTRYGQPCDVAAFPYEYDRMYFRTFVYSGPATTADFIVADSCNIVATATITQRASYVAGSSDEIKQLEKNFYSYQAGYLKHLYRMVGYNGNFESWVNDGSTYSTYYVKFNDYDKSAYQWGDYIYEDSTVIIAAVTDSAIDTAISAALVSTGPLGNPIDNSAPANTTTSTTTVVYTTTTTSTLIP